jgi:aryl-alcohol dehydrogenase-like predicted oxidoreductase
MRVSPVGLGAGPLGDLALDDRVAARVIHAALDAGVNLVDTAPSYGASEDRIGRALLDRRERVLVVTKGGYGVPGVSDWTPEVLHAGVEQALRRLRTDRIDVFLLHSCDRATLERGDLITALVDLRKSGKVRAIGYSGDGAALAFATACTDLDVLECSVNLVDREALRLVDGRGVLAKRAMANAGEGPYAQRFRTLFEEGSPSAWDELAVRWAAHQNGVACALVGTKNPEHIVKAMEYASRGPLPSERRSWLERRYEERGRDWTGVI